MSPSYTYVCSDNVLDMLGDEREFSTSTPSATDAYDSNMSSTDGYVPWFIDPEISKQENTLDFNTNFENQQWDYRPKSNFLDDSTAYQGFVGNLEPLPLFLSRQSSGTNSISNEAGYTESGQAVNPSSLGLKQQALFEIAVPTKTPLLQEDAEDFTTSDLPPSPKRRKASTSTTSTMRSPIEDYRKGHNAIEKRYRSNLNAKILSLEQCLPIQEIPSDEFDTGPPRTTKSSILTRAVQHIEFLKQNTKRLTLEAENLNTRFRAMEKLALGSVVEVVEVEPEDAGEVDGPSSPESTVGHAILNSKILTRRRQKRRES